MNRENCEAVLYLHRRFLPRRRTGRGFLTGTVFLDAALLLTAFVLALSPFVLKPGIAVELPQTAPGDGIRFNDMVLTVTPTGQMFFNDEQVQPDRLDAALHAGAEAHPGTALILQMDRSRSHTDAVTLYNAAARAGFREVFIAVDPESASVP